MYGSSGLERQNSTNDRIRAHTAPEVNHRIDRETRGAIEEARRSPAARRARIEEIEREWSIDRALMLNFGIVGAVTAWKAMRRLRRTGGIGGWGLLFAVQMGFLINHAVRGWCPPMPIFRRLGFRSSHEICAERVALAEGTLPP